MKREEKLIREIRRQCCFLHDHESFIENILRPVNELIPHDAQGVTGIDAETYNPRGIYYGYPPKYLSDVFNIKPEDIRGMKRQFELGLKDGWNTSTTESFGFDFRDDAAYKIIYEPHGFRHGLQSYFFSEAGAFLGYSGLTKKSSPGFTDEEIRLWEEVAPYILHAFRKYRCLVNMEFFNRPSLDDMIFAVFITDRRGRLLWSNPLARDNIPELGTSGKLPEGLKPCLKKITGFFQEKYDPFIYRELEESTTCGSAFCFAVDDSSSKDLPVKGEGVLFVIDSNYLNSVVIDSLTKREKDILRLIANGKFDKEIACELKISEKTVNTHTGNLFRKLRVNSRTEAAVKAVRLGLT